MKPAHVLIQLSENGDCSISANAEATQLTFMLKSLDLFVGKIITKEPMNASPQAEGGVRLEPAAQSAPKQSLPLQEPEKVQGVLPEQAP